MQNTPTTIKPPRTRRGLIEPTKVKWCSFITITLCLIISVITSVLAIWDFTRQDTLWRTVATCVVIAGGMMAFGIVNALYGPKE
ncbi:MAG: hypothetical protein H7A43_11975 [Verrucomicrobia bacterium]|nr:hypothetical protein [Verrucomicrobiota bacterium]